MRRSIPRGAIPLLLLALAVPAALVAQSATTPPGMGAIAGVVYDSLGRRALAGAHVQVAALGSGRRDAFTGVADSVGRFRLDGVPAGPYAVAFIHHATDTLGLALAPRRVDVGSGRVAEVVLAFPSAATVRKASCPGAAPADRQGLLMGRVLDAESGAPVAGAAIDVAWLDYVLAGVNLTTRPRKLTAQSNADGWYRVCNVPTDSYVSVTARAEPRATGALELHLPEAALLRRDLRVGASVGAGGRGSETMTGRVLGPGDRPHPGARVTLRGTELEATAGADGAYRLAGIAPGTQTLEARAIGYLPAQAVVDVVPGVAAVVDVRLDTRVAAELDAVVVRAKGGDFAEQAFARRQQAGFGYFLGPDEVRRRDPLRPTDLFLGMPGVKVTASGGTNTVTTVGSLGRLCTPAIFIDGTYHRGGMADLDLLIPAERIAAVEVYTRRTNIPTEYSVDPLTCGAIVIWSRTRFRPEVRR